MRLIAATVAGGLMTAAPALAQETFAGVWDITVPSPQGENGTAVWTVTSVGGEYVIETEVVDVGGVGAGMPGMLGEPVSTEIDFDGTSFTVTSTFAGPQVGLDFIAVSSGVIDGDTFMGSFKLDQLFDIPMTGKRR